MSLIIKLSILTIIFVVLFINLVEFLRSKRVQRPASGESRYAPGNPPEKKDDRDIFGNKKYLECKQCGGTMTRRTLAKHSQLGALFLIIIGIILCFFIVIIGIPILLIGLFMGSGSRKYWICSDCGIRVERI